MRDEAARLSRALEWLARLPLCGEPELAGLLDVDEEDARRLIHQLSARGWTETVAAGSPELEQRRLAVIRDEAMPALAAALRGDRTSLASAIPARPRDLSRRVARLEVTVSVNRFFSDLADDFRCAGLANLADARSLPLAVPPAERWWLPNIEAYGCLRSGRHPCAVLRGLGPAGGTGRVPPQAACELVRDERPCRRAMGEGRTAAGPRGVPV